MSDLISREEVLRMIIVAGECEPDLGYTHLYSVVESLPSAEQVTSKLKNPCDSLLTDDKDGSKEQKSKLDLISRADAIDCCEDGLYLEEIIHRINALPSADAEPIVIRAKTFMRKEDFDKWAEDIKRQGENVICIPCDAEVVSADAESDDLIIKGAKGIKDGLYNIKDGELFQYKAKGGTVRAYKISSAEPSVEIKECKPLCTEQKIAVEEFLNAPRITEECAIELLQMTGWLQEHDKEIGRPSGEWIFDTEIPIGDGRTSAGYRCSVCGADYFQISERANYCMVCGARMENKK